MILGTSFSTAPSFRSFPFLHLNAGEGRSDDPAGAAAGRREARDSRAGMSILIVEDEALTALNMSSILRDCGYGAIGIARTAEAALQAAGKRVPTLVLMDITLHGDTDGIETARELQSRFAVPILYVTAHADEPTMRRARATNPAGYLIKPFTSRQLESAVEAALDLD